MMTNSFTLVATVLITILLMCVAATSILLLFYYKKLKQLSKTHFLELTTLQNTVFEKDVALKAAQEETKLIKTEMLNLQEKIGEDKISINYITPSNNNANALPYKYALKLLQEGADINALRIKFNLSKGEADVLQALHMKNTHLLQIDSHAI